MAKEQKPKMKKEELVEMLAKKTGTSKKDANDMMVALVDILTSSMKSGKIVPVPGIGIFQVRKREKRTGINPMTKKTITIPATKYPHFKAGKAFKDAVK